MEESKPQIEKCCSNCEWATDEKSTGALWCINRMDFMDCGDLCDEWSEKATQNE